MLPSVYRPKLSVVRPPLLPAHLAVALAAGALILPLCAQESSNTVTNRLPDLVVTATKTETPISATAASVTVITSEELAARQAQTLADALNGIPSLTVVPNGTPGQATSVFTRGTESNHTLLTIDGRRVPANLAGGYDYANLSLDNIERIEVVETPSSVLYGGDAIGGVINLISKTGRGLTTPESEVAFEGGSFNTFRESASTRGMIGKFDYAVSASQFNADYPRDNNNYRLTTFRGSFGYEVSPQVYLDLKTSYYQSDGGSPGSTGFPSVSDHLKREVSNISPGIVWTPSDKFESKLYYTFDHQFQPSNDFGAVDRLDVTANQIDWQNNIHVFDSWTLTAGFGLQDVEILRTTGTAPNIDQSQTSTGGYLQSQWSPVEGLNIINSVRYDHYSDYDPALTWRQAIAYKLPTVKTVLHASVARSYAPPSAQDLYYPFGANPNLKPEKSDGWEVGAEQPFLKDTLFASATFFQNKIKNFIELDPFFTPQNLPKATTEGVELALRYKPCKEFETRAGYTYLTATDDTNLRRLIRRPRHQLTWDVLARPIEKLTVSAGISWVVNRQDAAFPPPFFTRTNQPIEDYLTLRAAVTYQATKNVQVWVRGENLTDDQYSYVTGYPALRLGAYGGVRVTF